MQYAVPILLEPAPNLALTEIALLFYVILHASVGVRESQGGEKVGDTVRAVKILR